MKSRRVHRVRKAREQAEGVVETYRTSARGLLRVFTSMVEEDGGTHVIAARRAAHHLAEVESMLPRLRAAIRSGRYPGAEKGDSAALVWGLWSQLSEASVRIENAVKALEMIGKKMKEKEKRIDRDSRRTDNSPAPSAATSGRSAKPASAKKPAKKKAANTRPKKKKATPKKGAGTGKAGTGGATKARGTAKKRSGVSAKGTKKTAKTTGKGKGARSSGR